MKTLLFSRTLALTGLALSPAAWLISGCGGGGGGGSSSNNGTPRPTSTATATATAGGPTATPGPTSTPTATRVPGATPTFTPIPTPRLPPGVKQRITANVDLGGGQIGAFNLVISRGLVISGIVTVAPIINPATNIIVPGTYAISGAYMLPNKFQFGGVLKTVAGANLRFDATGTTGPNTITVTVGSTVFPTQPF